MPDAGYVHRVHIGHGQRGAAGRQLTALSVVGSVLSGVAQQALGNGVGFSLNAFLASQSDGFAFDFTKTDRFFQENTGPTLADDVGESIGLALESREWNGRTLAEVLAAQTELRGNGSISTVGVATPATYNTANGQGTLNRVDSSNSSGVKITVEAGKYYILDIEKTGGAGTLTIREVSVIATSPGPHPQTRSLYYIKASDSNNGIYISNSVNLTSVDFTLHSIKEVPGKHATQATGSLKPTRQSAGCKFDGSDDNLLSTYTAGSGANFIGCKTTVPASIASTQLIMGASGSSANRCFIGVDTSGYACGGVGSDSTATIVGTSDIRNTEADIFLTFDGSTVRLIVNGVVEYEAAQNSTATTTIPFRLGANNNNGTAGSFYGGAIREAWVGREYINAARAAQIASA